MEYSNTVKQLYDTLMADEDLVLELTQFLQHLMERTGVAELQPNETYALLHYIGAVGSGELPPDPSVVFHPFIPLVCMGQ